MTVKMRAPGSMVGKTICFRGGSSNAVPTTLLLDVHEDDVGTLLTLGFKLDDISAGGVVPDNRRTQATLGVNGANGVQVANAFSYGRQIFLHFEGAPANDFNAVSDSAANMIALQGASTYDTWRVRVINTCGKNVSLVGGANVSFANSPVMANNTFVDLYTLVDGATLYFYTEGKGNAI
jgi:hypothetical protein